MKFQILFAVLAAGMLAACASGPKPSTFSVTIAAADDVNPDAAGRASPIAVKVYALASENAFQRADFFAVFDKSKDTLKDDLIDVQTYYLQPGGSTEAKITTAKKAAFVGVAAGFQNIDAADWRAVAPARNKLTVTVERDTVSIGK